MCILEYILKKFKKVRILSYKMPTKVIGDAEQGKTLPELIKRAAKDTKIKRIIEGEEEQTGESTEEKTPKKVRIYFVDKEVKIPDSGPAKSNIIITNKGNFLLYNEDYYLARYRLHKKSGEFCQIDCADRYHPSEVRFKICHKEDDYLAGVSPNDPELCSLIDSCEMTEEAFAAFRERLTYAHF